MKAQIAGDLMPAARTEKTGAGLGFYALSPEFQDDRVDATTRGFLGLTVACAHMPRPQVRSHSDQGLLLAAGRLHEHRSCTNSRSRRNPRSKRSRAKKKKIDEQKTAIDEFHQSAEPALAEVLAANTADYLRAAGGSTESRAGQAG